MTDFNINDAIEEYKEISESYQNKHSGEDETKGAIDELNKKCEDSGIVFKADFKSIELHTPPEYDSFQDDDSYSYEDEGDWS